ncbi:MAG TPA: TIGR03960 family B12-binding radical SAM protein [Desulfurivibrio alkaliphilus]|uniref:TIGR03960 family B12-binding radical SAM protein n=1 Tax=Desulfurivibrio alkaliphilus TaxID=427923 RepID=A0A7C2XGF6_9BACT|nr:TIGR03960 family B12-binding radical SAM protein [Desulfurivibrio alkaliphilus]
MDKIDLDTILAGIARPGRYCGNEFNAVKKDWDRSDLRLALIFPDLYEIGMSHQGLQILYHLVNARPEWLAERAYAPDLDLEAALRQAGLPLFSLESRRPLADFDLLGITLPYELCYSNILTILDLAGLPLRAAERGDAHPLVIGGGPCAFHPEPVADFFDAILLGDGEEALPEILTLVERAKREEWPRSELLPRLAKVAGVYVPSFFQPRYDRQGFLLGIDNLHPELPPPRRRVLADLDAVASQAPPLVPATRIVHDRLGVEIARGCTRGCRFCQAGIIYRPVRERDPEKVLAETLRKLDESGFDEAALLSLSTGDYACINDLLIRLMDALAARRVSLSLPSMRVGTLTREMMKQIRRVRKTGFTLAPEAGSERLRRVINKGISEADLLNAATSAFSLGWQLIKLYFMFGLPTETEEDLAAIPELAGKVLRAGGGRGQVTVSSAIFVPKPHTPFEREPQLGIAEGFARIDFLKEKLRNRKFKLKWHDPRQSFLEGVFCRGDRRLGLLLEKAWRAGARLDAWSDHFNLERWQTAAAELGLDLDSYLRRRRDDEPQPWDHIDVGVERRFLVEEYRKALVEEYTPDCRVHGCAQCGLCDFKRVKPVVFRKWPGDGGQSPRRVDPPPAPGGKPPLAVGYRLIYARRAEARLLGHLEIMQIFFRAFRRAGWPLSFSQGFNPSPKVSFGPALPLGTESLAEFLWLELTLPLADSEAARRALNRQLPSGLEILSLRPGGRGQAVRSLSAYRITLPREGERKFDPRVAADLLANDEFVMTVQRKGKERTLDVRPAIHDCVVHGPGELELVLVQEASRPTVKPLEAAGACFSLAPEQLRAARVLKLWSKDAE